MTSVAGKTELEARQEAAKKLTKYAKEQAQKASQVVRKTFLLKLVAFREKLSAYIESEAQRVGSGRGGQPRPDLKALAACRADDKVADRVGEVPGLVVNDVFMTRAELAVCGAHVPHMRGIATLDGIATSVVASGGFVDDTDSIDEMWYTGEGGNDTLGNRKQVKAQNLTTSGNLGLKRAVDEKRAVRVFRKSVNPESVMGEIYSQTGHYTQNIAVYTYDGLYEATEMRWKNGRDGYPIVQFRLVRRGGQVKLREASGGARAPVTPAVDGKHPLAKEERGRTNQTAKPTAKSAGAGAGAGASATFAATTSVAPVPANTKSAAAQAPARTPPPSLQAFFASTTPSRKVEHNAGTSSAAASGGAGAGAGAGVGVGGDGAPTPPRRASARNSGKRHIKYFADVDSSDDDEEERRGAGRKRWRGTSDILGPCTPPKPSAPHATSSTPRTKVKSEPQVACYAYASDDDDVVLVDPPKRARVVVDCTSDAEEDHVAPPCKPSHPPNTSPLKAPAWSSKVLGL